MLEKADFYQRLEAQREHCRESVEAHRQEFEVLFANTMREAKERNIEALLNQDLDVSASGVLEILRTTEAVSDDVTRNVASLLNIFILNGQERVAALRIDVFLKAWRQEHPELEEAIDTFISRLNAPEQRELLQTQNLSAGN